MKYLLIGLISVLFISGCATLVKEDTKWFDTEEEAISNGLKEAGLDKDDILGAVTRDKQKFIFFKNEAAIGLAHLAKVNNRFSWVKESPYTVIGQSNRVKWDTKTYSGEKFWVIAGTIKDQSPVIETNNGNIVPEINKKENIYFTIVKEEEIIK